MSCKYRSVDTFVSRKRPPEENHAYQESSAKKVKDDEHIQVTVARNFNDKWKKEFPWMEYNSSAGMICKTCVRASAKTSKVKNPFVTGSKNYQKSALVRHEESGEHIIAKGIILQQRNLEACREKCKEQVDASLMAQMRTAVLMCRENIPDRQFPGLIELQRDNGCSALQNETLTYKRHEILSEMQAAASLVCKERVKQRVHTSPYLGILLDESLDIAVQKKLVIFCRTVHGGKANTEYLANVKVQDGKSETITNALMDILQDYEIDIKKVIGLGTDGANVMVGSKSGVGVRLKEKNKRIVSVWCIAHRLALVAYWAAASIAYMKKYQSVLITIYNFFSYSACRYQRIRDMCQIMGKKARKFKKPTQVRWLSHHDAVQAIESCWGCLVLALEQEAAQNDSANAAKAKGILAEVHTYKFLASTMLLLDVLQEVTRCSKVFQKEVIDIDQVEHMLDATLETLKNHVSNVDGYTPRVTELNGQLDMSGKYQGVQPKEYHQHSKESVRNLGKEFVACVESEMRKRFSPCDMQILKDLSTVLNPRKLPQGTEEIRTHGSESLERLIEHFGTGENPPIDPEETKASFLCFKRYISRHKEKGLAEISELLLQEGGDIFPNFAQLAAISLAIPLTSVPCERGFSVQNDIQSLKRNNLSLRSLHEKILVKYEAKRSDFDKQEFAKKSCIKFQEICNRKK